MNSFEVCLSAALEQPHHPPVLGGKFYLAAVSGGADSTAMLAGMAALREEAGFTLHCVHIDHGIRSAEESLGDKEAVEALCKKLSVPCSIVTIPRGRIIRNAGNGGPGIEGAARIFRYRALNAERRRLGADWILTGHTRDDLLETLLMRILKGAGPAGLAPMQRKRGHILRPIIDMSREDVLKYLEEKEIPYRTDASNMDTRFFRNRIRSKLVPLLDREFPYWRKTIAALAETQSLTEEFLASEVRKRFSWDNSENPVKKTCEDGRQEVQALKIREEDFMKAPPILREDAVFAALNEMTKSDALRGKKGSRKSRRRVPGRSTVRRAVADEGADLYSRHQAVQDLGPIRLEHRNGFVFLSKNRPDQGERGFSLLIKEPGLYTLKRRILIKVTDGAKLPVVLRDHRAGDRISRGGQKRSLSDILGPGTRLKCRAVITACAAKGPSAFIVMGEDLTVFAGDDEDSAANWSGSGAFQVRFLD